jgi:hypothetical protein
MTTKEFYNKLGEYNEIVVLNYGCKFLFFCRNLEILLGA